MGGGIFINGDIYGKVLGIMERISRAQPGELRPDTDVFEEGYLDSFAAVEFIVALSEMFGVALDIADVSREMIATPEKATLLIEGRRQL